MIKKYILFCLLFLSLFACVKMEYDGTFATEEGRFIHSSRTVYLYGLGDQNLGTGRSWIKNSWQTIIGISPESGIDEYMKNLKEPHIFLDEDAKIHIFKTAQDRDEFINKLIIIDNSCIPFTAGITSFKFFRDFEVTSQFIQLKQELKSQNISINNLRSIQTEANDSIAAVMITNPAKTHNIQLTFYKDADFKGTSLAISVPKCDEFYENKRINMAWKWVNIFVNKWHRQKNLNDTASSLKIDFV